MIAAEGEHYLYRHIRKDKDEPFYIGVGTKGKKHYNSLWMKYRRANSKNRRNPIWNKIVKKSEYIVEILLESDNYDFILQKEIEFIKLYGRIDLGTGILSNLTDGGEGVIGRIYVPPTVETRQKMSASQKRRPPMSEETKRKVSEANKGRKRTAETKEKIRHTCGHIEKQEEVKHFLLENPYSTLRILREKFKIHTRTIVRIKKELNIIKLPVLRREDGIEYFTEAEACKKHGVSKGCIQKCIEKGWKVKGYLFQYINSKNESTNKRCA